MCPAGVFIMARRPALARPVELLLARAEALLAVEWEMPEAGGLGFGLGVVSTANKPVAGSHHA